VPSHRDLGSFPSGFLCPGFLSKDLTTRSGSSGAQKSRSKRVLSSSKWLACSSKRSHILW
jgi:hypothetical protein